MDWQLCIDTVDKGWVLQCRLKEAYVENEPDTGLVITTKGGENKTIEVDTIVLGAGSIPEKQLYEDIKGKVPQIHLAGDCIEPRTILEAIADGYRLGLII